MGAFSGDMLSNVRAIEIGHGRLVARQLSSRASFLGWIKQTARRDGNVLQLPNGIDYVAGIEAIECMRCCAA